MKMVNSKPMSTTMTLILLFLTLFLSYPAFAKECMMCTERADGFTACSDALEISKSVEPEKSEVSLQGNSVFSTDVLDFIEGTELSHAAGLPDSNETVEALKAYLEEMEQVKKSIKKRFFNESIDTGGDTIEKWLEKSAKHLESVKDKYPESRHVSEGLGRIYREMYEHTFNSKYLVKAADEFIYAEEMGIKNGVMSPHYIVEVADILSTLGDLNQLDKYFSKIFELNPQNDFADLYYAKALSKLNDKRADEFYKKAISLRQGGNFLPVVNYAEHLLDRRKDEEAISVLQELTPSEDYAYYPHFLKSVALEKIGRLKEAEEEYKKYLKFRDVQKAAISETEPNAPLPFDGFFKVPSKYRIPGSKLQNDIPFKDEKSGIYTLALRATPCNDDDWMCKAQYYGVWTINGEAEKAGWCGSGTIGMMRAVGWNIRTRVFWQLGRIDTIGCSGVCFNYASKYKLIWQDINSLAKRYYYVIETGGYAGLLIGNYTTLSEQVVWDVVFGRVPDPIAGSCLSGFIIGDSCSGICTSEAGPWFSFPPYWSGDQFRAGQVVSWWDWGISCYKFVPMSTPRGAYCGQSCWNEVGPVCPVMAKPGQYSCYSDGRGFYYYDGPCYGNIFWRFNM